MSLSTLTVEIVLPVSPTAYPDDKAAILAAKDVEAARRAESELIHLQGKVEIVASSFTRSEMAYVNHEYVPTEGVRHCEAISYLFRFEYRHDQS